MHYSKDYNNIMPDTYKINSQKECWNFWLVAIREYSNTKTTTYKFVLALVNTYVHTYTYVVISQCTISIQ